MIRDFDDQVAGVAALHDPVRRALYHHVAGSTVAVSRDEAAEAVRVQRSVAAFHLDRLAKEGLIEVEFRRLNGRSGPGAGRPAKLYRRSDRQIDLTLPARAYDLAGLLLARAIEAAESSGRDVREELDRASFSAGCRIGEQALARAGGGAAGPQQRRALVEVLREHGFEPRAVADGVVLSNCPFHALAAQSTELVCGMNLQLLAGVRSVLGVADGTLEPRLEPAPGQCCVTFCGRGS